MPFKPHPIQVQALRIARRFQRGFRPTKIAGKPVAPASIFSGIKFDSVPAFVLSAEIGHLPGRDHLIDELCQRGYLRKHHGYPKCMYPRMEYVTEDGTRVYVHDEDWGEIDVLSPNSTRFRRHLGAFSGRVTLRVPLPAGANVKPSKPTGKAPKVKRRGGSAAQGVCYEILPDGFKLLDEIEGPCDGEALTGGTAAVPVAGRWPGIGQSTMTFLELRERVLQIAKGLDMPPDRAERTLRSVGFQAFRMLRDATASGRLRLPIDLSHQSLTDVEFSTDDPNQLDATERAGDLLWQSTMEELAHNTSNLRFRFGGFVVTNPGTVTDPSGAVSGYKSIREYPREEWRQRAWDYAAALKWLAELAGEGKRDGTGLDGEAPVGRRPGQGQCIMDESVVGRIAQFRECVGMYFTYYLEDDVLAVLKQGRPLAVELERADLDTTNLLLFLHAVNQYGKGVERAKLLWPDFDVSLDRFTIRRAIGEGKRDGETPPGDPATSLTGEEATTTINKMLENVPPWEWKKAKAWLAQHDVKTYTRATWASVFGASAPKTKGNPALVNEVELNTAIRSALASQKQASEFVDSIDARRAEALNTKIGRQ
jgi:hypothetical protein